MIKHIFLNRWTNKPCAVCSTGDERVDEEFMSVTGSNVERGVAILVHTVDLTAWYKTVSLYAEHATNVTLRYPETKANINSTHRSEWASGSEWTAHERLSCAEDSSHPDSEEGGGEIMYQNSDQIPNILPIYICNKYITITIPLWDRRQKLLMNTIFYLNSLCII